MDILPNYTQVENEIKSRMAREKSTQSDYRDCQHEHLGV